LIDTGLLLAAIKGHSIANLNAQIGQQVAPDGTILYPGIADNPATQEAIKGLLTTIESFTPVQLLINAVEAPAQGIMTAAGGPPATDNASNSSEADIGVNGNAPNAPFYLITGSSDQASALIGNPNATNLIVAGAEPTQMLAGNGVNYLVGGPANAR
jgi:hypothetical protein